MKGQFHRFTHRMAEIMGSPWSFILAIVVVMVWAVTGPIFHFSDTWQLVINSITSVVTFLMVFIIQNTQNRDAKVLHLKLDELIRAVENARNNLVDLESLSDEELSRLEQEFHRFREQNSEHVVVVESQIATNAQIPKPLT